METIPCIICNSTQSSLVFNDLSDHLSNYTDLQTSFVRCTQCGLIFQNPRPTIKEISRFYPDDYECYEDPFQNSGKGWIMPKIYQYGFYKKSRLIVPEKSSGRLLDVGCATGLFLNNMQRYGQWDLYGVEPSPYAAEFARKHYPINIFQGNLEGAAYPDHFFDVVTFWDVLEHIHDPFMTLQEVNRILKDDGVLVVRVPNAESWDAKLFGQDWAGLDSPRHLYLFSPKTLSLLFQKTGFEIRQSDYSEGTYTSFLVSLRFWEWTRNQHRGKSALDPSWIQFLSSPVMRILSAPIFVIPGLIHHGPLLTVVARKTISEGL